jgi:hypothetical protein
MRKIKNLERDAIALNRVALEALARMRLLLIASRSRRLLDRHGVFY